MTEGNVPRGVRNFKKNAEKLFQLEITSLSILGEDIFNRVNSFWRSFAFLKRNCDLIKWLGSSGTLSSFSAFFLNTEKEGYRYFIKMSPEGEKFVIGLSDDIADLLEIILLAKEACDLSNQVSEQRKLKRIDEIKQNTINFLPRATKNLDGIVKILWPEVSMNNEGDLSGLGSYNSALLYGIQSLDLKDMQIQDYSDELEKKDGALKEKEKELKDQIESLKNTKSEKTSKDFSHEYAEIREKVENQTNLFGQLHFKIFLLRLITYAIPICLFVFHACEFFGYRCKEAPNFMKSSFFVGENSKEKTTKEADLKFKQNSQKNSQKNSNESESYLYFHLALITTLLIAFQQLRSAIAEMKAKKNLIEVYRHRELVARNFNEMRQIVVGDVSSQIEVTKSAAKALFENEPSIKENSTSTKDFGITNNFRPGVGIQ